MKRRTKNNTENATVVTGIAWYSSEQWAELRRVASDPEELETTYEEWQAVIKRAVPDFIKAGYKLVKVPVDLTELADWCRRRGRLIDADARAQYVVETLRQRGASCFQTITTEI
jgi:hypothetical protein